ncbi:MAG: hypothetical protein KME09_16390 [Pleurocapsa minor HA4230-MV1]|jgi:hypothetical protein|nr:hypothetical protein [Pleurocapsa minor HA4230-MV1]
MTVFTPGTGTIQASTYEAAALVAAQMLQDLEGTDVNNIAVNYFTGDNVVQIQWAAPIATSLVAGKLEIASVDYITYGGFVSGNSLSATGLPAALLEIFQNLQELEKVQQDPENPDVLNRVQISIDLDALTATVNAELPISFTASNGAVQISAVAYLADRVVQEG